MAKGSKPKKKWIAGAIKRPGAFTRYCKEKGMKNIQKCARRTLASSKASTRRKRQASLAITLGKISRKKK